MGPLGFLCLDTDEGAGNMGMLDMVLALEWVQDNIHLFGGDKDRVTIFGESAGAAAIGHLALSPLTNSNEVSCKQCCQLAKFDPFLSLDCARVEGVGAQSKERKGSNFAA